APAMGSPPRNQSTAAPSAPSHPNPAARTTASLSGNGNTFEDRLRTKSSPLVRRIAAEHNVDIAGLQGSGIAGRVTKRDIVAFLDSGAAQAPAARASMHAPGGVESHGPSVEAWPGDTVEPMSKIRRLTSDHMVAARRSAAHVTSFFEIDLTRVARIRQKMRGEFESRTGQKLTFLPFILKTVVDGLKTFPVLNAATTGTSLIYRKQYILGIAVALEWGLIVPVIKNADDLSLSGLAKAVNDL